MDCLSAMQSALSLNHIPQFPCSDLSSNGHAFFIITRKIETLCNHLNDDLDDALHLILDKWSF